MPDRDNRGRSILGNVGLYHNPEILSDVPMQNIKLRNYSTGAGQKLLADEKCSSILFNGVNTSKESREKFIQFLEQRLNDSSIREKAIDDQNSGKFSVTLEELIGSEGVNQLKAAILEEVNSREYREALFDSSTYLFSGDKKPNIAIIVAGPSSSGKTFSSIQQAEKLINERRLEPTQENIDNCNNFMVSCDGGIIREVSQMRKAIAQFAHILGYSLITDLHKETEAIFEPLKDVIKDTVRQADCGIIMPETFSYWYYGKSGKYKKDIDDFFDSKQDVHFINILEEEAEDAYKFSTMNKTIKAAGTARSGLTREKLVKFTDENIYLNIDSGEIGENKKYSAGPTLGGLFPQGFSFTNGITGSAAAGKYYEAKSKEKEKNNKVININYALTLVKPDPRDKNNLISAKQGDEDARIVPKKLYKAWQRARNYENYSEPFENFLQDKEIQERLAINSEFKLINLKPKVRAQIQADYMNYIRELAIKKAFESPEHLYDPQGRLIVDVKLDYDHFKEYIVEKYLYNKKIYINQNSKELIDGIIGFKTKDTVTVSFDVHSDQEVLKDLQDDFYNKLKEALPETMLPEVAQKIITAYEELPKGSIIALYQEYYFHLKGAARTYKETLASLKSEPVIYLKDLDVENAFQATMEFVNEKILEEFAQILANNYRANRGNLKIDQLNEALDLKRVDLLAEAHELLYRNIRNYHPDEDLVSEAVKKKIKKHAKHIAETNPATGNDVLHITNDGVANFIQNSEITAHFRARGKIANKQKITHYTNENGEIVANTIRPRLQVRVPSLPIKEHATKEERVKDVVEKLEILNQEYDFSKRLSEQNVDGTSSQFPKVFVYNLYTSIYKARFFPGWDQLGDFWKFLRKFGSWRKGGETGRNVQTRSADDILRGSHIFNMEKNRTQKNPLFCFVQNIPVNYQGNELTYTPRLLLFRKILSFIRFPINYFQVLHPTLHEATLMTDMAFMNTIVNTEYVKGTLFEGDCKGLIDDYKNYLKEIDKYHNKITNILGFKFISKIPARLTYFSETEYGAKAQKKIENIKKIFRDNTSTVNLDKADFTSLVKNTLKILVSHDLHHTHGCAKLMQTLSVYLENVSISGCKSGNERTLAINGRVLSLDIIARDYPKYRNDNNCQFNHKTFKDEDLKDLMEKFRGFHSSQSFTKENIEDSAIELDRTLGQFFDKYLEQLGPAVISQEDQHSSSKLQSCPEGEKTANSNFGERGLDNLKAANCEYMQAHKAAQKLMTGAVEANIAMAENEAFNSYRHSSFFSRRPHSAPSRAASPVPSLRPRNETSSPSRGSTAQMLDAFGVRSEVTQEIDELTANLRSPCSDTPRTGRTSALLRDNEESGAEEIKSNEEPSTSPPSINRSRSL